MKFQPSPARPTCFPRRRLTGTLALLQGNMYGTVMHQRLGADRTLPFTPSSTLSEVGPGACDGVYGATFSTHLDGSKDSIASSGDCPPIAFLYSVASNTPGQEVSWLFWVKR